jgi:hypothetical protein
MDSEHPVAGGFFGAQQPVGPPALSVLRDSHGQATVEAAVLIPLLFLLILILLQPAILLYNQIVMENAAAESCRLLSTRSAYGTYSAEKYEAYTKRRLASIPPIDIFHAHPNGSSWKIILAGGEESSEVSVRVVNYVKPLPLIGWGMEFLGMTDSQGYFVQEVEANMPTQPSWVWLGGGGPSQWVGQWE